MEKSVRTRLLTATVLVVVFGAGFVLGMAAHREPPAAVAQTAPDAPEPDSAGRRHRTPLYMQVDPTDAQKAQLDSLLRSSRESMRALTTEFHQEFDPRYEALNHEYRAKYSPRYDSIIQGTRAEMRKVLTPEQAAKWESLLARQDSARAEERRRGGNRGSRDR